MRSYVVQHTPQSPLTPPRLQLNHINALARMLTAVRKPYLNLDTRNPPLSRQPSRNIDLGAADQSWANIRHLTNEERDQIDLQARLILSRCRDRVQEMEALEKRMCIQRPNITPYMNIPPMQAASSSPRVAQILSRDCFPRASAKTTPPRPPTSSPHTTPA